MDIDTGKDGLRALSNTLGGKFSQKREKLNLMSSP